MNVDVAISELLVPSRGLRAEDTQIIQRNPEFELPS